MRVAPVGLFAARARAFELGASCAAITHGHPSGYLSAGALAAIIAAVIDGESLEQAVGCALRELGAYAGQEECSAALQMARELAGSALSPEQCIARIGQGWVGEEALAIAVYCALKFQDDFRSAIIAAVNHSGDSDSTGSITGNILGAYLGVDTIPKRWIDRLELSSVITRMADDLEACFEDSEEWVARYPGY